MILILIGITVVFLISTFLTGFIREYILRKNVLDIPNERSLHSLPTPRGGGIIFVLLFVVLSLWLALQRYIPLSIFYALSGGLLVATIGYLDDVYSIRPLWRVIIHLLAAMWAVYWLGGLSGFGRVGYPLTVIGIVWCINLYNFMDGIDGLAGVEGVFISLCAALALSLLGISGMNLLCFLLAGMIAGFLIWNWPPAKIFMGDVGSGYLGYVFSVLAIATVNFNLLPCTFWITISAAFLCDATFTVLYRMCKGEAWYKAHRNHAYQQLVRYGVSHKMVTIGILMTNILILFPIAFTMLYYPEWRFETLSLVLIGYFVLWLMIMTRTNIPDHCW